MYRRSLCLMLLLVVLLTLRQAAPVLAQEEPAVPAVQVTDYDLSGDGQHVLTKRVPEESVELSYNGVSFYQRGQSSQQAFMQLLIGDLDADDMQEAVIVEADKTATPSQVSYLLFDVTPEGWKQLDTGTMPYSASISSMLVQLADDGPQFLLGISRTAEEHGLSYVEGYSLFRMASDESATGSALVPVWQALPEQVVRLEIKDGSLVEKQAVFAEDNSWPSAIERIYYVWDGSTLVEQKRERSDHYYLEELCLPELFEQVSREQGVPVEILRAVAQQESNSRQFDYGDYKISFDGGIGLMQVTPRDGQVTISHLGLTYQGEEIERLKWDTYFNLTVGAQILRDKWLTAFGTSAILPRVGRNEPAALESWYFSLWAYNGYVKANFPGEIWGGAYQEQVIGHLPDFAQAEFSYPVFADWNQGDELPRGGQMYTVSQPTTGTMEQIVPGSMLVLPLPQGTNLRRDPATYSTRLGILGVGSRLTLVEEDTGQSMLAVFVEEDTKGLLTGFNGYVSRGYINLGPDGAITKADVNLRSTAEVPTTKLGTLNPPDIVQVVAAESTDWLQVEVVHSNQPELVGVIGYLARLSGTGLDDPALQTGDQVVLQSTINLRSYPSVSSEEYYSNVVAKLPRGKEVEVLSGPLFNPYDGYLWYQVSAGEQTGYVAAGLLAETGNPVELFCEMDRPRLRSGKMLVAGASKPGVLVELYVNDTVAGSTMTDHLGKFIFSADDPEVPVHIKTLVFDQRGSQAATSQEISWDPVLDRVYTVIGSTAYIVGDNRSVEFGGQTAFRSSGGVTVMAIHLFRELGASVTYLKGHITINYNGITAELVQGSGTMQIIDNLGTRQISLGAPIVNVGGRTYIPTRDVSENLGFDVLWEDATDSINITAR